ncbi:MAG: hypothetical protein J6U40_00225 [Kiritimatiellae bacterium]|nr:hypothetical protein [Kiritimatiellia bacterium]MBP5226702.1 hypothetical protein [Kiritimatiellia bacterium]
MKKMRIGLTVWMGLAGLALMAAPLPEVPEAAIEALGSVSGIPQNGGFVFVNGRYLPPPYTVSRVGNGIFINRVQVEQPVPWSRFEPQAPKAELDPDGDFEDVDDRPIPQTPPPVAETDDPDGEPAPKKATPDNNDFEDDPDVVPRKAKPKPEEDDVFESRMAVDGYGMTPVSADTDDLDELFGEEEPAAPKKPAAVRTPGPAADKAEKREDQPAAKRDVAKEQQMLKTYLDKLRRSYELGLARNEIYFFGSTHNRINGNYGSARSMIEVLPDALRVSSSPEDLLERLRRGGVYFLDIRVVRLLYQNKASYPLLKERLKKIKTAEAAEAERRKRLKNAGPAY